ncbi:FxLYD domain-containing protein [Bacillales bacterium AN1005]|uniref:FxLYD domain-containing protein n=1 Tax=Niallia taxi TaxID=2499688 RepID=UPI0021A72181|nr:FxLYD domain-containing protein [Niallia taxi]MCT2347205.1 FxLYD domain-containing protein [Niallia taxi]
MNKIFTLFFALLMVIGIIGCSNQSEKVKEKISPDDVFIEEFSKAINERWAEQDKLEGTEEDKIYTEKNVGILEKELKSIEKSLANVEDKELKELGNQYVEGAKSQIEMFKTNDLELQFEYNEKSEKLRKPALIKLVDEYNVIIEEKFQQTYKDFKEQATVINKENDANNFAEKLAQEIVLKKTTDEYGDLMYTAIVENTSDIEFESIHYDVQLKDSSGIVIGNEYIYLENFMPGTKQKVELTYLSEDTATLELSLNYLELK